MLQFFSVAIREDTQIGLVIFSQFSGVFQVKILEKRIRVQGYFLVENGTHGQEFYCEKATYQSCTSSMYVSPPPHTHTHTHTTMRTLLKTCSVTLACNTCSFLFHLKNHHCKDDVIFKFRLNSPALILQNLIEFSQRSFLPKTFLTGCRPQHAFQLTNSFFFICFSNDLATHNV